MKAKIKLREAVLKNYHKKNPDFRRDKGAYVLPPPDKLDWYKTNTISIVKQ